MTASILLTIVAGLPASLEPAQAQMGGTSAIIETPAVWLVMPGGETSLEIRIENKETLPHQTMILLRGLPAGVELSQGRSFGANVWVLPTNRVGELKARIAADATGKARITVAIATLEGNSLAERSVTMVISTGPLQSAAEGASTAGTGLPIFRPKPPDRNLAAKLIAAGHDSMTVGNVLVARQFYQRAAEYGLADAATALAATYDKVELQRMGNMASIQPDPELAKRWYEIAEQLRAQDVSAEVPKPH